jgi:periplasmic divalent cation tolerance protein
MTDKSLVLTTAGSHDEARRIADVLIERRLAACVSIVPKIESVYRWQGQVDEAEEWLLLIKTTQAAFERVRAAVCEHHSYKLPEFMAISIDAGSPSYLKWIEEAVQ